MARRLQHSLGVKSTLSYIDMISGGFGAAFFLFLIFVSFPIETASTPSSGSRFLDIWLEWNDTTVVANMIVEFTPEASETALTQTFRYTFNSQFLTRSTSTGLVTYTGSAPKFWTSMAEAGFGLTSDTGLQRNTIKGNLVGQWMRFSDPCPGTYQFAVASHGLIASRLAELFLNPSIPTTNGRARFILSNGDATIFIPEDGTSGIEMTIKAGLDEDETRIPNPVTISVGANTSPSSLLHC